MRIRSLIAVIQSGSLTEPRPWQRRLHPSSLWLRARSASQSSSQRRAPAPTRATARRRFLDHRPSADLPAAAPLGAAVCRHAFALSAHASKRVRAMANTASRFDFGADDPLDNNTLRP